VRFSKDEKREQSARRPGRKERERRREMEGDQQRQEKRVDEYRPERYVDTAPKSHGDWAQARRARNQARADAVAQDAGPAAPHRKTGRKFIKAVGTSDYRSAHNRGGQMAKKRSAGQGRNRPAFQGTKKGGKRS
jgi:hypothetical protein